MVIGILCDKIVCFKSILFSLHLMHAVSELASIYSLMLVTI